MTRKRDSLALGWVNRRGDVPPSNGEWLVMTRLIHVAIATGRLTVPMGRVMRRQNIPMNSRMNQWVNFRIEDMVKGTKQTFNMFKSLKQASKQANRLID